MTWNQGFHLEHGVQLCSYLRVEHEKMQRRAAENINKTESLPYTAGENILA